jgi:uncharacterized membrane protein
MRNLYLISVWIHVLAAATWIGSMVFLAAVLVPTLRRRGDPALTAELMHGAGRKLRVVGWTSFALLLATGTVSLAYRDYGWEDLAGRLWQGGFGLAFACKMTLFGLVLLLSALHDFWLGPLAGRVAREGTEAGAAERLRQLASWMGRLNLLLALGIVLFAVFMVRGWPG